MPLTHDCLNKYAEALLWGLMKARTGRFKRGDIVLIRYDAPALRLAEILYDRLLGMGINPIARAGLSATMERSFFEKANGSQLVFHPPGETELYGSLNGSIFIYAPESLTHLKDCDPKKIARSLIARKALREILDRREETGEFGWTLCTFPTTELAKNANLSLAQYTEQIIKACFLDSDNPASTWETIYKEAGAIKKWLNGMDVSYYHIQSENIDLRIKPGAKRRWIGVSGHNIPSFELFVSPDWRGTEGHYFANQPSFRSGNYVEQIRLVFEKGCVVSSTASTGKDFTRQQLSMDKGAGRIGEFSLTDRRFSRIDRFMADTLFDENYGGRWGNCHIAVGASFSETYDGNPTDLTKAMKKSLGFNDSALHWDMVNTEDKIVTARLSDGKAITIYENGIFCC
ncbi:MAG TPA: aminopeptidase [Syntrophales bacterium]|nr:aminopeptidase [Syntrophales bacterium]HPQ43260.1 aminopeptidase [Syntrophales bacterium]